MIIQAEHQVRHCLLAIIPCSQKALSFITKVFVWLEVRALFHFVFRCTVMPKQDNILLTLAHTWTLCFKALCRVIYIVHVFRMLFKYIEPKNCYQCQQNEDLSDVEILRYGMKRTWTGTKQIEMLCMLDGPHFSSLVTEEQTQCWHCV